MLDPEEDAFGQKLLAAYTGEEVHEIVERDDGYIDAISARMKEWGFAGYFSTGLGFKPVLGSPVLFWD